MSIVLSSFDTYTIPQNGSLFEPQPIGDVGAGAGRYVVVSLAGFSFLGHPMPATVTIGTDTLVPLIGAQTADNSTMRVYGGALTVEGPQDFGAAFPFGSGDAPLVCWVHVERGNAAHRATVAVNDANDATGLTSAIGFAGSEGVVAGDRVLAFHVAARQDFAQTLTGASALDGFTEVGEEVSVDWNLNVWAARAESASATENSAVLWTSGGNGLNYKGALIALSFTPDIGRALVTPTGQNIFNISQNPLSGFRVRIE